VCKPKAILAFSDIDHGGEIVGPVYYQRWVGLFTRRRVPGSALYVSGCALLIAPGRFEDLLFDEDFFMYGEDIELGWRLMGCDGWFAHVAGVWVRHEGSASSGMGSEFYESRMVAAHLLLGRRLAKGRFEYALMIFGRFLTLTTRAGLRVLRYRSMLPIRALWSGWHLSRGHDPLRDRASKAIGSRSVQLLS
jgi:GT2 family glycosyltransferase